MVTLNSKTVIGVLENPPDGYILAWNDATKSWLPRNPSFGPSGPPGPPGSPGPAGPPGSIEVGGILAPINGGAVIPGVLTVPVLSGVATNDQTFFSVIGSFEFDVSKLQGPGAGTRTIKLQVILETTGPLATIQLFNFTAAGVVNSTTLTTTSTDPVLLTSIDLSGATNLSGTSAIYQVQLKMNVGAPTDRATCSMAKLLIEYT